MPRDDPESSNRKRQTDWFTARAADVTQAHLRLKEALANRERSAEAWLDWQVTTNDFHKTMDVLYEDLETAIENSKQGDLGARDHLVAFLEADPWCFRSGYTKGRLYDLFKRVTFDSKTIDRLTQVLLLAVDKGGRTEFRSACRLAGRIADAALVKELRARQTDSDDPSVRRRAQWMLAYVPGEIRDENGSGSLER